MNYQEKFNEVILKNIPSSISLAQEISDLLGISLDSAYRRLRNQTEYSISEAMKISFHFDIPLEALNVELGSVATFKINHMNEDLESYKKYLESMWNNLERLSKFENAKIIFAAEDIPVFYHFSQPNLMRFKIIYWLKSLLNIKEFQYKSFENIILDEDITSLAKKIFNKFETINSTEIWTSETISSTLKQIKFYWDAGFFDDIQSALLVLEELELVILGIKKDSETGYKFSNGNMTSTKQEFYLSDVMIGNNSILAQAEEFSTSFISYSTFNYMQTTNVHFNEQNQQWLNTILSKSTLLSGVAEKYRNQFFISILKQIKKLTTYIKETEL